MKSEEQIRNRLRKLYARNMNKHIKKYKEKSFNNCEHNEIVYPKDDYVENEFINSDLAPRKQVTLVVINPQVHSNVCTYSTHPSWNGTVCDSDDISKSCPYFSYRKTEQEAKDEFNDLMSNDEWVLNNMPDIAALQWVLEERIYKKRLLYTFFGKIIDFFRLNSLTKLRINENSGTDSV